ncbi:MAG: aminotransferase class V-fold PLP-dependent enzyme [Bryobacterales bacterium]|nr:aminotransferase class V-fold PLP-dependent enzyme [Bryobacterales bacterium]
MPGRRTFLQTLSTLPVLGNLMPKAAAAPLPQRDFFKELAVVPFINAAGTYTALTASLMSPEVMSAMQYASRRFVNLISLQDAVGARIAQMLECEAAVVTSGAAGALTIGTAACITGKDQARILRIPDLQGMKNEVLIQKSHRYGYDHAVRTCGVRMVEIETADDFEKAAGPQTAMALFFNDNNTKGRIDDAGWVALGKKHGIPTFNDASADALPVSNLKKYTKMGFDLVTFSGGKGLCGPQSAGLLLGRKDLIEAARLNTSPYSDSIARGQKVNKEEILGMMVALELYLNRDHDATWKEWERRVAVLTGAVKNLKTMTSEVKVPEIANHTPHLYLRWDPAVLKIDPVQVRAKLFEGTPSIQVTPSSNKQELVFTVWMLQPGEAEIVAGRLKELFRGA